MASSDSNFPRNVVQAEGNPSWNPTSHYSTWNPTPGLVGRGPVPRGMKSVRPPFVTRDQWAKILDANFESTVGSHVTPYWSGNMTRKVNGILTNEPSIEPSEDGGGPLTDDKDGQGLVTGRRDVVAVKRDQGALTKDEQSTPDPFGNVGSPSVVARSGNNDPNAAGDDFTAVGAGRAPATLPGQQMAGLGAFGDGINWPAVITIAAVAAIATYFLARPRK
jgi:hypothetical protein